MVTLTNSGSSLATIPDIYAGGDGDFAESNNCGSSLAAGSSCAISVTFTPVMPGQRTGELGVFQDLRGQPQTVGLSGTGGVRPGNYTVQPWASESGGSDRHSLQMTVTVH